MSPRPLFTFEEMYEFDTKKAFIAYRIKEHNKRILTKKKCGLLSECKYEVWEYPIETVEAPYYPKPEFKFFETFNERYDHIG